MYSLVSRVKNKRGEYKEYYIKHEESGKVACVKDKAVRKQLKKGIKIKGLKLSSDDKILLDNSTDNYDAYTGEELKAYRADRTKMKERYAVNSIYNFCNKESSNEEICGVVGVRGTGKTIALLHTIDRLNDYNNTVYIEVKKNISVRELLDIIELHKNNKYIFIDEITRVKGFMRDAHLISSRYASFGKKIIISGTDSYVINKTLYDALCHRMRMVRMGYISYEEQHMLEGIGVDEYIKYGGILDSNLRVNKNTSKDLMEQLVVENIVNSIVRNMDYYREQGLLPSRYLSMDTSSLRVAIRTSVFYLYYSIILSSFYNMQYIRLDDYVDTRNVSLETQRAFLDSIGVGNNIEKELLSNITEIFINMGLIKRVDRYNHSNDFRYYITTPAISYKLYYDFVKYVDTQDYKTRTIDKLFESMVVCEISDMLGEVWYFMENKGAFGNVEIDAVARLSNGKIVLVEAKAGRKFKKCKENAKSVVSYKDSIVAEKLLVFRENFPELDGAEKQVLSVKVKLWEDREEFVSDEVYVLHFSNMRNTIKEIYDRNCSEDSELSCSEWEL